MEQVSEIKNIKEYYKCEENFEKNIMALLIIIKNVVCIVKQLVEVKVFPS